MDFPRRIPIVDIYADIDPMRAKSSSEVPVRLCIRKNMPKYYRVPHLSDAILARP
jgi:hypothetical protein